MATVGVKGLTIAEEVEYGPFIISASYATSTVNYRSTGLQ